jgi:hypothetical protein
MTCWGGGGGVGRLLIVSEDSGGRGTTGVHASELFDFFEDSATCIGMMYTANNSASSALDMASFTQQRESRQRS